MTKYGILRGRPPNYETILKVFPQAAQPNVIFAYQPNIYSQKPENITLALMAHERVHLDRQVAMGVDVWWDRYLSDPEFRYEEELLAHRAEYEFMTTDSHTNRNARRSALKIVSKRLSSALYGKAVTCQQAMADITKGLV